MAKNADTTKSPEEQEAEDRAKSQKPRTAGDAVADVPAATSEATSGKPREGRERANPSYAKQELIERSAVLLGQPRWVTATALHDVDDDATLTIDKATGLVEKITNRGRRD